MSNQNRQKQTDMFCIPVVLQFFTVLFSGLCLVYFNYMGNTFPQYFVSSPDFNTKLLIGFVIGVILLFVLVFLCMNGLTDWAWLLFVLQYAISFMITILNLITKSNTQSNSQPVHFHRGALGAPEV